ncbi:MAG: T9SS type A sorting domain-containing protein [Candidatus Marinimicrobia bacterium]|nr:T9SS type A sorting domain-containing protein [Candidatus Neomarinimicrobiota bacterium]
MKSTLLIRFVLVTTLILFSTRVLLPRQLAFPTAEGYGKYATGGRGGKVYEVTNLNSSGSGSFGAAISASGPRIVVFKVSGEIKGNFTISNDDITIAGQTAPGGGITIRGSLSIGADNVIIRYIRVRNDPSVNPDRDALSGRSHKNIIIDHVSVSWGTDEVFSLYHNDSTTVQWCIISEACPKDGSDSHRFGGIWGNNYGTWHHNLIVHNDSRNPRWASGCGYNDFRNNVLYNWGYQSIYGAEAKQPNDPEHTFSTINMIANYFKPGPASTAIYIAEPSARSLDDKGSWYVSDNYFYGHDDITADNWKGVKGSNYIKLDAPWDAMPINQQTAEEAYELVLDKAGCTIPKRDKVDEDIIDDVKKGIAKYGNNGIIDSPSDVGGWPELESGTPYTDNDHDGIADDWEDEHGLDSNDPLDRNEIGAGGYTNLEVFLCHLAGEDEYLNGNAIDYTESNFVNGFSLSQNYPNPFNSSTMIKFSVPYKVNVKLDIYDIRGNKVAELFNGVASPGKHEVHFDAKNLSSGIYVYKLEYPGHIISKKMLLIK